MKKLKKTLILITTLLMAYCGNNSVTQQSENAFQNLGNEINAQKCNGKGSAFSGKYHVASKAGILRCEGTENTDIPESEFDLDCTQVNQQFLCTNAKYQWNGCINQDGSFVLGIQETVNAIKSLEEFNKGALAVKSMSKISGKISGDTGEGKFTLALLGTNSTSKKGCAGSWPVSLQFIEKKPSAK